MVKRPLSAFPEFGGLEPISGALIGELQAFWMTLIAKQGIGHGCFARLWAPSAA